MKNGGEKKIRTEYGSFARQTASIQRRFRTALNREMKRAGFIPENEERLWSAVRESADAIAKAEPLPTENGAPRLFSFARLLLQTAPFSEKNLKKELYEWKKGGFSDGELLLLSAFLTIASGSLWLKSGDERHLRDILHLSDVDFGEIFFAFSKVERIFLSEASGIYKNCDAETRSLYHARLARLAKAENADPIHMAKALVAKANAENTHLGAVLPRMRESGTLYFLFLAVMALVLLLLYGFANGAGYWNFLLLPLSAVPFFGFAKLWLTPFFRDTGEKHLPRLVRGDKTENTRVLVSIATFLYGEEKDRAIFDKLEDFYLTNGGDRICFALLGDLPQSKRRTADKDESTFAYARARISALREKYGPHFYLFIRERRYSPSEGCYIGWERKRGGVLELCRHLRGQTTSLRTFFEDEEVLRETKYLITLDADTNLYIGAVEALLGTALHPENEPYFDPKKGRVTRGHAVIQPRMIPSLLSASGSAFAKLTGGTAGLDPYAGACFDLYQDLFDEGVYCGKGILDIDIFLRACGGFFPKERILSHDLAEGNLLRAALASDIILSDGTPKNALSYYMRQHRWLRGDLQILPYLRRLVKNEAGETVENPMDTLSKYKILDNLLRAATPLLLVMWLAIGFIVGGQTARLTVIFVLLSVFWRLGETLIFGLCHRHFTVLGDALGDAFFQISAFAYEAYLFADAAVRTLYRFFVSRKNFLNWTTAFEGDRLSSRSPDAYYRRFLPSVLIGTVFFCLPSKLAHLFGIIWVFFPLFMFLLSREKRKTAYLSPYERRKLLGYAKDTWLYFRDFTNEKTHGLPPDNVQFSPTYAVAMRTSPTNIGMYLLSLLAARDMNFIGKEEFFARARMTAETLVRLRKWNGHLYNWYELHTLSVLGDAFVSTVDSGNLLASLIAFCEGAKEYVHEMPALVQIIDELSELVRNMDFRVLYDEKRELFTVGYSVSSGKYTESYYDTFMSEARTASFAAAALRQVPPAHYFKPSRRVIGGFGSYGVASWSGTAFEYFMPAIFLPRAEGSLTDFALLYAYRMQKKSAVAHRGFGRKNKVFGISECGYFAFDGALNYQYRAFGVASLALDPVMQTGKIIAPYASFLMLENAPEEVLSNLETLEKLGVYGKYGFYEALDADSVRVGNGFAVLQSVMAHHAGMSILSVSNLLWDGVMRKRFMRHSHMRAARELLCERIPASVSSLPKKHTALMLPPLVRETEIAKGAMETEHPPSLLAPETAMLSNNKTKIFFSSSGHMEMIDGRDAVFLSDFDRFSLGGGLCVYVNIDGTVFPTVPLGTQTEGVVSSFSFVPRADMVEYRSQHQSGSKKYGIRLRISVFPDRAFSEISCAVSGDYTSAFAVLYFEPVLTERKTYLAHKSFSDLFIESKFFADEEAVLFHRRPRHEKKEVKYFGVTASPSVCGFDTMRDCVFREADQAGLAHSGHRFTDSEGALILPACAVRSATIGFGKQISFYLGQSYDADELLYLLAKCCERGGRRHRNRKMGALLQLQYSAAGLSAPAEGFERFLLGRMIFGTEKTNVPRGFALAGDYFWRHSVSGENPIVLARLTEENDAEYARLAELLCLFKYLCIRGLRYDFVIFYRETDGYFQTVRGRIASLVRRAGCENFVSFSCGIYPVDENDLSEDEKRAFSLVCAADFDLSEALFVSMSANMFAVSRDTEMLLKKGISEKKQSCPIPRVRRGKAVRSGYFHEDGFLVGKGHGGAPFSHVLASPNFGTVLTENSLGFTFARNAGMQKLTPHTADGFYEDMGERLILRIYDRSDDSVFSDYDLCASSAWADFRFGGARYHGCIGGISYTVSVSLVGLHDMKKITVSLDNREPEISVSLFFAVKPCLGTSARASRFYRYQKTSNGMKIRSLADRNKRHFRMAVLAPDMSEVYTETAAFRTDGTVFDGMEDGVFVSVAKNLTHQTEIRFFLLAYFSEKQYTYLEKICLSGEDIPRYAAEDIFAPISVKTAFPLFDEIQNRWSIYQTLISRIYARSGFYQVSGAYGFRDQLQDGLALIPVYPELTKILILRAAAHQYEDGSVQHWWHGTEKTGIRTRCSDDFLWLPFVTAEYIERTGDRDILNLNIPYLSSPLLAPHEHERYERAEKSTLRESLLSHLLRAVSYGKQYGAHGLPLIGTCDWNDGMSAVGIKGRGESVWLAFFRILVLRKMCSLTENKKIVSEMETEEKMLYGALKKHGFDGKWYRRGYYDDGSVLGGDERNDCKIDVLPQAFAAILASESGFEKERVKISMDSAWEMLYDREHLLVRLLYPPFDKDAQAPGYIKGYVPGIRENGGQYTHAAVWMALGLFLCGETEKGAEILFAVNPAERYQHEAIAEAYRIEPYVFAGDVYANEQHTGRGGWSFYTGSAAWYRKVVLEVLYGYTERADGFYLHPRLCGAFPSFSLTLAKKQTRYHIDVSLADAPSLMLDGEYIPEKEHYFFRFDGKEHRGFLKIKRGL